MRHGKHVSRARRQLWNPYFRRTAIAMRLRPFALRLLITARPPFVAILARKPWVLTRFTSEGW
jgi:hypothetical protein